MYILYLRNKILYSLFAFLILSLYNQIAYAATPQFWTQPRQLSQGSALSSDADACSRNDEIYVVWSDNRTGNNEIFLIFSLDAGQTWGKEERLTDTTGNSVQPAIACDARNLYLVWCEKTEDDSQIYYKKWDGTVWSEALLISGDHKNSLRPDISVTSILPGFYIYVVWNNIVDDRTISYLTRSIDSGRQFSAPTPITTGNWSSREPAIWCGTRDAYLVWSDNREGSWNIYFKRWGEIQVSQEAKLSVLPDCRSPVISGLEPDIYVAWQCVEKIKAYADIFFSSSPSQGIIWNGTEKLTEGEAESVFPKLALLDKSPWIFWQDGRNGQWQIFLWTPDSDIDALTTTNSPGTLPDLVTTSGQIHLFWTNIQSGSNSQIMYMRRDTIPPKRPGTPFHFDLTAEPGYDDDNQITFSWEASSKSSESVKYNVYSKEDNGNFALAGSTDKTSFNVPGESGKVYQVYVEAVDEVGNFSPSSGLSPKVMCDPDPPAVIIHSPSSNSTIRGDAPIIASVNDTNLMEFIVEYGITAAPLVWQRLGEPFQKEVDRERIITWETADLNGIYTLRISASDKAGNESRVSVVANIDSQNPINISSGSVIQLTDPDAGWTYGTPAWSPRSDAIAYHSNEGGTGDIWIISPDGLVRSRLTRNSLIEQNPSWSPSGNMLAFQSFSEDNWDVWVIGADGKNAKKIISDQKSNEYPAWSPDGSTIAFNSDRDGDSEIFLLTNVQDVLNGADAKFVQLTENNWDDKYPTWSPDGSRIVFQSLRRGNWGLYEIGIDGKNQNIVLDTNADEIEPEWSPDRKRLLFSTNESGTHYEIHSINWPQVTGQIRLSPNGEDARHGSWSPAMDSIVYQHNSSLYLAKLQYPTGALEAIISWPRSGEIIKGQVDIIGTARGKNFQSYSLLYSKYGDQAFQLIDGQSTSPVIEPSFLGRWYVGELTGEYLLKLVVTGNDGSYVEDSVRVFIANQLPAILIDEPENGLITGKDIISVSGRTEHNILLELNGIQFYPEPDGSFSRKVQLSEGANNLVIKAINPSGQSGEYTIERTVYLDTRPPIITIGSPKDFQVINVPYVTIKGSVDEAAEVSVLSKRVWPDGNGNFQQKVLCKEGTNLIPIAAFDKLGNYASVDLRVIFRRKIDELSDTFTPAIVEVFPGDRAVVTGLDLKISAIFIDDVGLDPFNIAFSFDGKEITSEEYSLDVQMPKEDADYSLDMYPLIHFTYNPHLPLAQGQHSFKINIQDTSGNAQESTFNFSVDTSPAKALLSAQLVNENQLKVTLASNKQLSQIHRVNIYNDSGLQRGYSLSSFVKKDGYYETNLGISPAQKSFFMSFSGETYLGQKISTYGYLAWDKARYDKTIELGTDDSPKFSSSMSYSVASDNILILRSQDGIIDSKFDIQAIDLQDENAQSRRLKPSGLVYILFASEEIREETTPGILSLPVTYNELSKPVYDPQRLIIFRWDEKTNQWQPLDRLNFSENTVRSQVPGLGIYTLFADLELPVIKDVLPMNFNEVALDNFFVEASIFDVGSGISQVRLLVDGKEANYHYDPIQGRLTYSPVNVQWGAHKIEIIATDRAGNVKSLSTNFITPDVFQFISNRVYPNPARNDVNIEFRLTKLANVSLRIYTISGDLVYNSEIVDSADGKFIWTRENNYGKKVASGVYIYIIEASLYDTKIRKRGAVAVIM